MKVSEVIKQLQELQEKHGDVEALVYDRDYGNLGEVVEVEDWVVRGFVTAVIAKSP